MPSHSEYNGLTVKDNYVSRDKYYNANDWYYAVGGYADRYETYTVNSITVYNDSVYDFLPLWTLKKSVKSFSTGESYECTVSQSLTYEKATSNSVTSSLGAKLGLPGGSSLTASESFQTLLFLALCGAFPHPNHGLIRFIGYGI